MCSLRIHILKLQLTASQKGTVFDHRPIGNWLINWGHLVTATYNPRSALRRNRLLKAGSQILALEFSENLFLLFEFALLCCGGRSSPRSVLTIIFMVLAVILLFVSPCHTCPQCWQGPSVQYSVGYKLLPTPGLLPMLGNYYHFNPHCIAFLLDPDVY